MSANQDRDDDDDADAFGVSLQSKRRKRKRQEQEQEEKKAALDEENRPRELFATPDFVKQLDDDTVHVRNLLNRTAIRERDKEAEQNTQRWIDDHLQLYQEWLSAGNYFKYCNRAPFKQQYTADVSLPACVAYFLILIRRLVLIRQQLNSSSSRHQQPQLDAVSNKEWNRLLNEVQDSCIGFRLKSSAALAPTFRSADEHVKYWQQTLTKVQMHAVMFYETWRLMKHGEDIEVVEQKKPGMQQLQQQQQQETAVNSSNSSSSSNSKAAASSHQPPPPPPAPGDTTPSGKEYVLYEFLEQAARLEAAIGFVLHKFLRRRTLEILPVELEDTKNNAWSKRLRKEFDDFMSLEPDGAMHAAFRDLILSLRLSCNISLQYRQLKPVGGHREQRVTVVDKMVTQQQLNELLDLINGVELKDVYANEDHPYHHLFIFQVFGMLIETGFRVKWLQKYLVHNDIFSERHLLLDKAERYHKPRCPVLVCLLGEWYLALGTDRLIWCPTTWSAVMAWIWFMDEEHGAKIEDGLSLAPFIDSILDDDDDDDDDDNTTTKTATAVHSGRE